MKTLNNRLEEMKKETLGIKGGDFKQIGQGVEDVIQGGIGAASPALMAAGPAGWTVMGLSFLEDMLFD